MNEKRQVSGTDEELIDILTAISVVSKRLARNLTWGAVFIFNNKGMR